MVRITFSTGKGPSSERAIAFAHKLMESKKQSEAEAQERFKSPEVQEAFRKLRERKEQEQHGVL